MSNEPKAGTGIDPELLAAYIDRRLSPEQIVEVEARLASDPDAYALLVESVNAVDELAGRGVVPMPVPLRSSRSIRWLMAGGVLAAAAAALLVIQPEFAFMRRGFEADRLRALNEAIGDRRPTEGRLSLMTYAARPDTTRSARPNGQVSASLMAAAEGVIQSTRATPRERAAAHLALGRSDDAIAVLTDAAGKDPRDVSLWSDLSAAYLQRWTVAGNPADLDNATRSVERALALDARAAAALFNTAVIAEASGAAGAAREAWKSFLAADAASPWAAEAQTRLRRIESAMVPPTPPS